MYLERDRADFFTSAFQLCFPDLQIVRKRVSLEIGPRVTTLDQTRGMKDMKRSCGTAGQDRQIVNSPPCKSFEK